LKTICFDVNNLAMRNLFGPDVLKYDPTDKKKVVSMDTELFKFRVFDAIYKSMYKVQGVNEIVLAMDDRRSWRKLYWAKYKAHRKGTRDKLDLSAIGGWEGYYEMYESFLQEIKESFPFKMIKCTDTEADDVIGSLCIDKDHEFYIISTDKDFLQLSSKRVLIYNPMKKKHVEHPNPELFLVEQSLLGQAKDNIFNVKTPLDYPDGKRKPGFGEKAVEKVISYAGGWQKWLEDNDLTERYEFNRNLMDFARIPAEIKRRISSQYDDYVLPDPDGILKFFKDHPWPDYMDNFTNVENKIMSLY
jgi:hypothetical protein